MPGAMHPHLLHFLDRALLPIPGLGRARPGLPRLARVTMTAAGLRQLQDLRRQLLDHRRHRTATARPAITGGISGTGGRSPAHR